MFTFSLQVDSVEYTSVFFNELSYEVMTLKIVIEDLHYTDLYYFNT